MARIEPDAKRLANQFSKVLRQWLTQKEMQEVCRRNKSPVYGDEFCATHDFCDSNMAMNQAYQELTGFGFLPEDDSESSEESCNLWSLAWTLAKQAEFKQID